MSTINDFELFEPHCLLPPVTRDALWRAYQWVKIHPNLFADVLAELNNNYSESSVQARELAESKRSLRHQMRGLRDNGGRGDKCDTFPRRRALRRARTDAEKITARAKMVEETIKTALHRGWRVDGNKIKERRSENEANIVKAEHVKLVWDWLDEQCRSTIRYFAGQRKNADEEIRLRAKSWQYRLEQAIRTTVKQGLPAGSKINYMARRAVLLAAIISSPEILPIQSEFAAQPWENKGHLLSEFDGIPWVPGRRNLFINNEMFSDGNSWSVAGLMADGLGDFFRRAVELLGEMPAPTADERTKIAASISTNPPNTPAQKRVKLTPRQEAILKVLKKLKKGQGLEGKEIVDKLPPQHRKSESTLRRHDFPVLIEAGLIMNSPGVGYHPSR